MARAAASGSQRSRRCDLPLRRRVRAEATRPGAPPARVPREGKAGAARREAHRASAAAPMRARGVRPQVRDAPEAKGVLPPRVLSGGLEESHARRLQGAAEGRMSDHAYHGASTPLLSLQRQPLALSAPYSSRTCARDHGRELASDVAFSYTVKSSIERLRGALLTVVCALQTDRPAGINRTHLSDPACSAYERRPRVTGVAGEARGSARGVTSTARADSPANTGGAGGDGGIGSGRCSYPGASGARPSRI